MLVLTRKVGEKILIGDDIVVTVSSAYGSATCTDSCETVASDSTRWRPGMIVTRGSPIHEQWV